MVIFINQLIIEHINAIRKHTYNIKLVLDNYFCQTPINLRLLGFHGDVREIVVLLRCYAA
jgi:hypothetical protein